VAVGDSTLSKVVWRKLQRNLVAVHDLNSIAPESSSHGRQHRPAGVEFDREHSSFKLFNYFTEYFNRVFFGQILSSFGLRGGSEAGSGEGLLDRTMRNGQINKLLERLSHSASPQERSWRGPLRLVRILSQPPDYMERQSHNRPYQAQGTLDGDPNEAEWQQ